MSDDPTFPEEFIVWARALPKSRRAETALEILIERGSVTTAELNRLGYDHPPRAIADLKDAGVSVERGMVVEDGRRMAQYRLKNEIGSGTEKSRKQLPKRFRDQLFLEHEYRCTVCREIYTSRDLQADHRVPFRIAGDPEVLTTSDFMPLCGSDNRSKSWTCEHCRNWIEKDQTFCRSCYWARPDDYTHIAGVNERRIVLTLRGNNAALASELERRARARGVTPGEFVAERLADVLGVEDPE